VRSDEISPVPRCGSAGIGRGPRRRGNRQSVRMFEHVGPDVRGLQERKSCAIAVGRGGGWRCAPARSPEVEAVNERGADSGNLDPRWSGCAANRL